MRYGLIADIHSNIEAFEAVLAHAQGQGVARLLLLGDLIGYGADPQAVLERCMQLVETQQAVAILGNHDALACGRAPCEMNEDAQMAIDWTRGQLKPRHTQFLLRLPLSYREEHMFCVHASAVEPESWTYVSTGHDAEACLSAAQADWVFSGHVHDPTLYYSGRDEHMFAFRPTENIPVPVPNHRSWLAIVGSCGQPRDRQVGARYAVFDSIQQKLTFFRVPYDHHAAAEKIRAAGLPSRLALYLEGKA
ncbi:metallophosphoesterase family protein [Uliginosibacterium gangwonense]|uniref:metallophosphoesterase family protein n=1 Tax=Uliginosibacterium gangwonense TaxID=392736 RepID=UPI00036C9CE4|nr:metallophosphoesterase family protein [Uliginosibacterium gangwonense]